MFVSLPCWHSEQVPAEPSFSLQFFLAVTAPRTIQTQKFRFSGKFSSVLPPFLGSQRVMQGKKKQKQMGFLISYVRGEKDSIPFQRCCEDQWLGLSWHGLSVSAAPMHRRLSHLLGAEFEAEFGSSRRWELRNFEPAASVLPV